MNDLKASTDGTLSQTEPLFASICLALFNELRRNYIERRLEAAARPERSQADDKG